jgi:UDP-galactopyranose mutase
MKTALIIGGGFAGCAAAHQLALQGGWDVTIVEKGDHLGAGVYTSFYGGHPYTFGPRHFLTQNEEVYEFLNSYLPLRHCDHIFQTYVEKDSQFYDYPIHKDDVPRMPESDQINLELGETTLENVSNAKNLEEYWTASVGPTLYEKFINEYSKKMWQIEDNKFLDDFGWSPKGVALKEGSREAWDIAISCYPIAIDGYNSYFGLAAESARVRLNTNISNFDILNRSIVIEGERSSYDVIINTISPDILFDECHGPLPYIGRDVHVFVLPIEYAFPDQTYFLYYAGKEKFTRLVEYKRFTKYESPHTLIGMEIPSSNGKHYPLPFKSEYERANKYLEMLPENVFSIGRAGSYQYRVDIDDCIEQAMDIGKKLK